MSDARQKGRAPGSNRDELEERRDSSPAAQPATHRYRKTDRRQAPKPTLAAPIEIGKFFKNRKGDVIAVALKEFEGIAFVDIRQFYQDAAGISRPTKKGVAVGVRKIGEFAALINKALVKAVELGLIAAEGAP